MFPQADLKLSAGGQNPGAIALPGGTWIKGIAIGEATVEMDWRDKVKGQVAVTVANDPWSDLQIKPGQATLNKGEALKYEVTATKGGLVHVLGAEQGLQLAVGDANIAQVLDDLSVGAKQEGHTTVVAKLGSLSTEATLDVVPGNAVATGVDPRRRHHRSAPGRHRYRQRRASLQSGHHNRGNATSGDVGQDRPEGGPPGGHARSRVALGRRNRQTGQREARSGRRAAFHSRRV